MEYFNLVRFVLILTKINLTTLEAYAKIIKVDKPESSSNQDQDIAFSDKALFQVVPSTYASHQEYGYPIPVLKNSENGIKVYEIHPVPVPQAVSTNFAYIPSKVPVLESHIPVQPIFEGNPLVTALLLSNNLGVSSEAYQGTNHAELVPVNPYIALLLSQYGRYLPLGALDAKGIYFYSAANNYHNNKPFGSYKVYEDVRR